MGQSHGPEGKLKISALAGRVGPAAGRADGEDDVLGALVAAAAEPGGEGFGTHLLAAAIQEHNQGGGSSLALSDRFEERFLATIGLRLAVGKD